MQDKIDKIKDQLEQTRIAYNKKKQYAGSARDYAEMAVLAGMIEAYQDVLKILQTQEYIPKPDEILFAANVQCQDINQIKHFAINCTLFKYFQWGGLIYKTPQRGSESALVMCNLNQVWEYYKKE
jgi:hypothetical protein